MKIVFINIFKVFLKIVYFFMKMFPTNSKKVVFISRQSNEITLDFKMLGEELVRRDNNIKTVFLCKRLSPGFGTIVYFFHMFSQLYYLATSKICIVDSFCIPVSNLKHKKSLYVIQIWHAIAKLKKSGYQTLNMSSGHDKKLAMTLNMHEKYDAIIAGGKSFNPYYIASFNTIEEKLYNYGLPRIDYLINNEQRLKKEILEKYPIFKTKKVVLYVPTFRTYDVNVEELIKKFDFENCALIVKCHQNQRFDIDYSKVYECKEYKSNELLAISDYVITDYSSMAIEAAVLNKKLLFYLFDYDKYMKNNGINLDPMKVLNSCAYKKIDPILSIIEDNNYDNESYQIFRKKYLPECLGNSTKQIVDLIMKNM